MNSAENAVRAARVSVTDDPPVIEHTGMLDDMHEVPAYARDGEVAGAGGHYSCSFCGVGDGGVVTTQAVPTRVTELPPEGDGTLELDLTGGVVLIPGRHDGRGRIVPESSSAISTPVVLCRFVIAGTPWPLMLRREEAGNGTIVLTVATPSVVASRRSIGQRTPTAGCVKLNTSMGQQRPMFPIHMAPSVLDRTTGQRRSISYAEAIERLVDLLMAHRPPEARTLVYACGQVDYFTVFAVQEVFRLLGITNLAGNAEHCLNSGAVHNELLTGQEGPFLTIDQAVQGPNRFFLFNG